VSSPRRDGTNRDLVVRRVAEADSELSEDVIAAAIDTVGVNASVLAVLARALDHNAGALGIGAPPAVGRLVSELRKRASSLPEPTCVRCRGTGRALTTSSEGGVCARCRRRQLATACARCGVVKPVVSRDPQGAGLCAVCAPRPRRLCSRCGRVRIIARRAHDGEGDVCDLCFREPVATCGVCGHERPCHFVADGRPVCLPCSPRRHLRCAHCGQDRPPSVRWPEGPVCEPCYRAALSRRGDCAGCHTERRLVHPPGPNARLCADCAGVAALARCRSCGAEERPYRDGNCVRCALALRTRTLIGVTDGRLDTVYTAIVAAPQPYSAHNWLRSSAAAAILSEVAAGTLPLSHEALDAHPRRRGADFLRHLLVANGVLAARNDGLVRLEAWVATRLSQVDDPHQRRLLRSYATWRVLRRARQRSERAHTMYPPTAHAKTCIRAAIAFVEFLSHRGHDLAGCTQTDIDAWLDQGPPCAPRIADFIDWAASRKLLDHFAIPGPIRREGTALDDDARWAIVSRLLHDDNVELTDRVAGCLVLLYGQQLSRIVALTRDQITVTDDTLRLQLGATHIEVPEPLAGLFARLARDGRRYVGVGSPAITPWLFPGLDPGRPLTAYRLGQRLRTIGIDPASGRRSALTHLAARLPAAMLATLINLAPTTAVHWVRTAGGDWTTYAAQLLRDREP
jgi:hypothetical protein